MPGKAKLANVRRTDIKGTQRQTSIKSNDSWPGETIARRAAVGGADDSVSIEWIGLVLNGTMYELF